jgi:hypothetical protein
MSRDRFEIAAISRSRIVVICRCEITFAGRDRATAF